LAFPTFFSSLSSISLHDRAGYALNILSTFKRSNNSNAIQSQRCTFSITGRTHSLSQPDVVGKATGFSYGIVPYTLCFLACKEGE
jgi:hypothetical protein